MRSTRFYFIFFLFFLQFPLPGQSSYKIGLLPSINTSIPLVSGWKVNTKIEMREVMITGNKIESDAQLTFELLDLAAIFNKKLGGRNSIGAGYLLRLEKEETVHRCIQQYAFGTGYGGVTIAHRVSADQTFRSSEALEYRLRYRIGAEIPLNGQSIDPGEWYLKCTNEYLGILQNNESDLEIRGLAVLGININERNKFELGPEYRVSSFLDGGARHTVWITLAAFLSF